MTPPYVELHARSAFSFLRGASLPEQLIEAAQELKLPAVALCDRDGVYGAPRFQEQADKENDTQVRPIVGAELTLDDGSVLPVLVATQTGYQNLCRLITQAKLRGTKQHAPVQWEEIAPFAEGLIALTGDEEGAVRRCLEGEDLAGAKNCTDRLISVFGRDNVVVEIQRHLRRGEDLINDRLFELAEATGLPPIATNGVLHATANERDILDVFTCIREHTHLDAAGRKLAANRERYLKSGAQMARLFADRPEALENTMRVAERLDFTLKGLDYRFPSYPVDDGETMDSFLHKMAMAGARARYSHLSDKVRKQLDFELKLITKLGFAGYFLIVWDIVNFCREQNILVQGRGSAANSVVCYALGITACDPISNNLLFERFLTENRKEWPDIDLDLPSGDRRERVIQEIYRRYGKHGAAMTANVITYRGKSAMREIGKALNFPMETIDRFSKLFASGDFPHTLDLKAQIEKAGMPATNPRAVAAISLYQRMLSLPRHLGQHSGGMIIYQGNLDAIVPLENASMPGRVVAQWDKNDCNSLKIIKVDLLGLGMMAMMQDSLEMCVARGRPVDLAKIPMDDPKTYELLCKADTIGTFQVESRAQMATLPRLQPKNFYDVVIEVAIIRPGPIQGGMLHPYLARRAGKEEVSYFDNEELLKPTLGRTLGVPLFQEQLLKMAMVMADLKGSEAEELRRALSFHRSQTEMDKVCVKLRAGMKGKGIPDDVVDRIAQAVQSFAVYGFPESHAISFALIAYASCWLKVHRAPEFYAGLLNNQPMGFYSSATLVLDAKRRGVFVRAVNVMESEWLCTVGDDESLRLGLCYVRGLKQVDGERVVSERRGQPFASLPDFQLRTRLNKKALRTLSQIGALNGLAEHRRKAQWEVEVLRDPEDLFARAEQGESLPLAAMKAEERMQADYHGTGLTTGPHPMKLIREQWVGNRDVWKAVELEQVENGTPVRIAGLVICRQRPGTAKGFVFVSLEDETGVANAVVTPQLFEKHRLLINEEPFLIIEGVLQNIDRVIHVKARKFIPLAHEALTTPASHDFH